MSKKASSGGWEQSLQDLVVGLWVFLGQRQPHMVHPDPALVPTGCLAFLEQVETSSSPNCGVGFAS